MLKSSKGLVDACQIFLGEGLFGRVTFWAGVMLGDVVLWWASLGVRYATGWALFWASTIMEEGLEFQATCRFKFCTDLETIYSSILYCQYNC